MAMKLITGWAVSVALVVAASAANAQMPAPTDIGRAHYQATSDVQGPGPYAGMPPETRYGPALLPPQEVYAVLRENGFSPLGIPHQRGYVYVIAVLDRAGEDGRLVIDARNGQIIRFMPAFRMGAYYGEGYPPPYGAAGRYGAEGPGRYGMEGPGRYGADGPGPYGAVAPGMRPGAAGPLPPATDIRSTLRPPGSIPRVASRTAPVPAPKPADLANKPAQESAQQPIQQSAAARPKPADTPAAASTVGQAKPVATLQPTQEMPKVQGLE
jgi:hypothetical protein